MFIYGCSSPAWLISASGCGIFGSGSNAYRSPNGGKYAYAEFVGSRTIIGYVTMSAVYRLKVFSSQVTIGLVMLLAKLMVLLVVYITVRSILPVLIL